MPLGSSMDYESADSRSKGCWDPAPLLTPFFDKWTSPVATPDFVVDEVWRGMVASFGFGAHATDESTAFWSNTLREVYKGDEGRKKCRMAVACLLERDGLFLRLRDIECPVYWLHVSLLLSSVVGWGRFIDHDRARRTWYIPRPQRKSRSNCLPGPKRPS